MSQTVSHPLPFLNSIYTKHTKRIQETSLPVMALELRWCLSNPTWLGYWINSKAPRIVQGFRREAGILRRDMSEESWKIQEISKLSINYPILSQTCVQGFLKFRVCAMVAQFVAPNTSETHQLPRPVQRQQCIHSHFAVGDLWQWVTCVTNVLGVAW